MAGGSAHLGEQVFFNLADTAAQRNDGRKAVKQGQEIQGGKVDTLHRFAAADTRHVSNAGSDDAAENLHPLFFGQAGQAALFRSPVQSQAQKIAVLCHHAGYEEPEIILRSCTRMAVHDVLINLLTVFIVHHPRQVFRGIALGIGIGKIEYQFQSVPAAVVIQQHDAFASGLNPVQCLVIPVFHGCTGCCVGPLSVNQKLVGKAVLVHIRSRLQKGQPVFRAGGYLACCLPCEIANIFVSGHSNSSFHRPLWAGLRVRGSCHPYTFAISGPSLRVQRSISFWVAVPS